MNTHRLTNGQFFSQGNVALLFVWLNNILSVDGKKLRTKKVIHISIKTFNAYNDSFSTRKVSITFVVQTVIKKITGSCHDLFP